ncbi:MAG: hypothetical protein A2932_02110 [Candidatus Spechtbacteria bacterium RIFCSPLOWO2_01_FULL_46_10]|uniref:Uncharacterized protein n=1 Tax=Candidatus Spechtbacteria bacterium RIFCSPLOWO2_01_FULL_46_10 TaxID=1802163 RepID=A0A1G2HFX1_9BACT|nr:MAG: hypothetical protein A2932_02110 [Candidatus Spechtbacteria bacterium RIFCSPLOWO2_01_FULL_46_10]
MKRLMVLILAVLIATLGFVSVASAEPRSRQVPRDSYITLYDGFTVFVWPEDRGAISVSEALVNAPEGAVEALFEWDNSAQQWKSWFASAPPQLNSLRSVTGGGIYWAKASREFELLVPPALSPVAYEAVRMTGVQFIQIGTPLPEMSKGAGFAALDILQYYPQYAAELRNITVSLFGKESGAIRIAEMFEERGDEINLALVGGAYSSPYGEISIFIPDWLIVGDEYFFVLARNTYYHVFLHEFAHHLDWADDGQINASICLPQTEDEEECADLIFSQLIENVGSRGW